MATHQNNPGKAARVKKKSRKVQFLLLALILLLTIGGILVAVYLLSGYNSRNTFEYQFNSSGTAYERAEYDKAITYIDRALELAEGNEENVALALQLKYSINIARKDYNGAIKVLLLMLEEEETAKRYSSLLELYSRTGNYAQIEELGNKLIGTQYYEIYKDYMVGSVSASLEDGTFDTEISVELTASKADLVIHYTIDGTKPTVESDIYNGAIKFNKEGTYTLRAMGINAQGVVSEEIAKTYVIAFTKTDKPVVLPESGEHNDTIRVELSALPEGYKAYYTLDGTVPTTESAEYKKPVAIKCGNFVMGFVVADDEGTLSDVVWRVYDVVPRYPVQYQTAVFKLKNKLIADGTMLDMDGKTNEDRIIGVNFVDYGLMDATGMITLEGTGEGEAVAKPVQPETGVQPEAEEKRYYVFQITSDYNGLIERLAGYYCISVDDGTLLEVNSVNE